MCVLTFSTEIKLYKEKNRKLLNFIKHLDPYGRNILLFKKIENYSRIN